MADRGRTIAEEPGGYVAFRTTGEAVKGEFHCAECGYGVTVYRELPVCPMCTGTVWEQVPWSPLTRALDLAPHQVGRAAGRRVGSPPGASL